MANAPDKVIIVCKEGLYNGEVEDMIAALKTIPTDLGKEDMIQHMNFIRDTAKGIAFKCEQERITTLDQIHKQEIKLEELRNEHVNIEDDNKIVDRVMAQIGCYTDCRMLKASIRRRKNLNRMLSEDEVKTLAVQKEKYEEIDKKHMAALELLEWADKQSEEEKSVIEILS